LATAPYISLIIPSFNRAHTLKDVLLSIARQDFADYEAIIVDDGSTDSTKSVIGDFLSDKRIRYMEQDNGGPSVARNTGMAHANGDIIVYCDSDDILHPNYLQKIAAVYKNDPDASYVLCNHERFLTFVDADGAVLGRHKDSRNEDPASLQDFYDWKVKTTSSGFSHKRKPFAGKASWKSGFLIEDLEFLMQLAVLDARGFRYIPEKLLTYDQVYGGNGMCSNASYEDYAHAFGMIYELHKNDPLMKNPDVYLDRVKKYKALHEQVLRNEIPPPQYKYFPELIQTSAK